MTLAVTDLAYAAALVDNLAVLKVREVGPSSLPQVNLNGSVAALRWLGELTGTKVVEVRRAYSRFGCSEHCPEQHVHIESRSARWSVTGTRATIVLFNLEPYLRVQGRQARELVAAGLGLGYKTQVVNDMAARGWVLPELREQPRARVARTGVARTGVAA